MPPKGIEGHVCPQKRFAQTGLDHSCAAGGRENQILNHTELYEPLSNKNSNYDALTILQQGPKAMPGSSTDYLTAQTPGPKAMPGFTHTHIDVSCHVALILGINDVTEVFLIVLSSSERFWWRTIILGGVAGVRADGWSLGVSGRGL